MHPRVSTTQCYKGEDSRIDEDLYAGEGKGDAIDS